MEGVLALGTPYILCLTAVLLLLIVYITRQKALEKRVDALVKMSRISGEVQGVDEISMPLGVRSTDRSVAAAGHHFNNHRNRCGNCWYV
jgi:hypothetical protein